MALIYRYFDPHGAAALDGHRSTLITTTLLLVLFSTMALGGLTKPMLDYIQGPAGEGFQGVGSPVLPSAVLRLGGRLVCLLSLAFCGTDPTLTAVCSLRQSMSLRNGHVSAE